MLASIQYATMVPYALDSLGDHRGMLIDINMNRMFGQDMHSKESHVGRKLVTKNTTATDKYLEYVEKYFIKQSIYERANKLYYLWSKKKKTKWEVMRQYEKPDMEVYRICLKSGKKCTATHKGKSEWSPALANAINGCCTGESDLGINVRTL